MPSNRQVPTRKRFSRTLNNRFERGSQLRAGYQYKRGEEYRPADASPSPGRAYTDDGRTHEHRGLKGRTRGRPSRDPRARKPTRRVPIPPELVSLLRAPLE